MERLGLAVQFVDYLASLLETIFELRFQPTENFFLPRGHFRRKAPTCGFVCLLKLFHGLTNLFAGARDGCVCSAACLTLDFRVPFAQKRAVGHACGVLVDR